MMPLLPFYRLALHSGGSVPSKSQAMRDLLLRSTATAMGMIAHTCLSTSGLAGKAVNRQGKKDSSLLDGKLSRVCRRRLSLRARVN